MWRKLLFFGCWVAIFCENNIYVSVHSFPACPFFVIPFQIYTSILYTIIILANVVILFEYRISVICVLFTNIFYTKIVHYQTCSSPGRAVRSHSLVCSKNCLLILGIGQILNKELELIFRSDCSDRTCVYSYVSGIHNKLYI